MLVAMARPMDPRPIHPSRKGCVDILTVCKNACFALN